MPEVSVIIPVYNAETHLRECLDSIRNQTFANIEVICVDDGSTDESPDILAEYAASDTRFRVERQTNGGAAAARNAGLACARGEFVGFLDSDDFIEPRMIENLLERIRNCSADVVISGMTYFDAQSGAELQRWHVAKTEADLPQPFSPEDVGDRLFLAFRRGSCNKLFRRSLIEENDLRFPLLNCHEDVAFVVLSLATARTICVEPGAYYHYRKGRKDSLTASPEHVAYSAVDAWLRICDLLSERNLLLRFGPAFQNAVLRVMLNEVRMLQDARQVERFGQLLRDGFFPKVGLTVAVVDEMSCPEADRKSFEALLQGDVLQVLVGWMINRHESSKKAAAKSLRLSDSVKSLKMSNGLLSLKNDELRGANGRLRTANDELRGANGRLRTANDELRGANGRLRTANDELRGANGRLRTRVGELKEAMVRLRNANDDLKSDKLSLLARVRKFERETALQMLKRWVRRVLRKRHK